MPTIKYRTSDEGVSGSYSGVSFPMTVCLPMEGCRSTRINVAYIGQGDRQRVRYEGDQLSEYLMEDVVDGWV